MQIHGKITLASASPRRAKILSDLGVDFTVLKTDAPETSDPSDPEGTVRNNALAKGAAAARSGARRVLSADTIVWHEGRIYGKPRDLDEARAFLRELSGKTHSVFTGVAFDGESAVVKSSVKFKALSDDAIEEYVSRVNPVDRAGAYDINEAGELVVESWKGSYENIMGLPVGPLVDWGIVSVGARKEPERPWEGRIASAAETLVALLRANGKTCATAESCTGGGVGSAITSVAGSSEAYLGGVVSYANSVKEGVLGVRAGTLASVGAVSSETAAQMAEGVRKLVGSDVAVSITGIAGPGGGSAEKPVGLVWFGVASDRGVRTEKAIFAGDRAAVRAQAVLHALGMMTVASA